MKKFQDYYGRILLRFLPKRTIRVMKLTIFLSILTISQLWATETYSQMTKLTLKLEDVKISDALKEIENQSEFYFLYSPKLIDVERKVNIDAEKESIKDILSNIFDDKVKFAVYDRQIILSPNNQSQVLTASQQHLMKGTVKDKDGVPLAGVNVVITGTTQGTMTDINGKYSIEVPEGAKSLTFSFIGMVPQEISIGTLTQIDVTMVESSIGLDEVVITGYSSQKRRDLTGAVGIVEPAELTAVPTGNVSNALQGRASGVTVTGNGQPGSTAKVRIRGFSSFENNDPLYVIDGVPTQDISSLNPNDIESMSVLKDAGSASIYGSRASNGVIIVTTRKGIKGTTVTYSMYTGIQNPGKGPTNLLNTQERANLQWLVNKNDDTPTYVNPIYGLTSNATPTLPSWAANTNWYDAITHSAPISNHDISLSGGNDNSKYFAGIGVRKQDGIVIYTHQDKYTARFNSEFTFFNGHLKVGENITSTYSTSLGVSNLDYGSPISMGSYREQSIIPVKWTGPDFDGLSHTFTADDWGGTGISSNLGDATNPVASLTRSKDNKYWDTRTIGSGYVDVKILQGLNFKSTIGGTFNNGYGVAYNYITYENSENQLSNSLGENTYFGSDWVWTNTLTLNKTYGQHKILAVAGYESAKYGMGRDMSAGRGGYFTDDPNYRTLSNGASINYANSSYYTPTTLVSQFMRADYSFMDRYMLSATVRRDGSSKFGAADRYGIFPSVSAGWRVSNEPFFKGISFINDLKLRGSLGTMGNQLAVSPQNQFSNYGGDPSTSFYAIAGEFSSSDQGFRPTRIGNPDAKWETNITTDIGFEASMLNSKISIKLDWYQKKTKDLLFAPELPGIAGAANAPYINIAAMSNKGLDGELSYKDKWGDLGFDGSFILTTYKNNIDKIANGVDFFDYTGASNYLGALNRNEVGHPISAFFGYKVVGLFQSAADVASSPTQDGAEAGFFKFQDTNGDGVITPDDRVFIGNPNPKFTYGFNLAFSYKNFDLSTFIYGSQGADIFNYNRYYTDFWPSFEGQKSTDLLYNSWTPTNTNTTVPKASNNSNFSTNTQVCSYYLEKGSYLKMKNLELGYSIPESLTSKINIKSLRIYIQGVNLFTITKYTGLDPELGGDDRAFGSDLGNYPLVKNFIFGLNLNF